MAVRKVNGRWLVEFMQGGHRVFKRLPEGATRADATQYETKLRREIFDQATLGKRPQISLEYAIKEWLREVNSGRKSERASESHANNAIGAYEGISGLSTGRVGFSTCAESIKSGVGKTISAATANRRLCVLKAVAKFAWRKGWTEENLSARIQLLPENNARARYLSKTEIESLIAACVDQQTAAFIAVSAYAGLRQGEVLALRAEDVADGIIKVADSKSGEPRVVPVVADLLPFLNEIPLRGHKRTLYARFESARDAAGIKDLVYHDLRRSVATILANTSPPTPLGIVAHILGHKNLATTRKVYALVEEKTAKEALTRAFPHQDYSTPYDVNEDK